MDSNSAHNPVFLIFPPEISVPDLRSTDLTATTCDTIGPFPKLLATKMKILGAMQILFGVMNFSFGVVFLFTLENPYPRFPFIFVSGYPFWSSVLNAQHISWQDTLTCKWFINSGAFLVALERKTTKTLVILSRIMNSLSAVAAIAGIILLTFGLILDQHFFCGYAETISQCQAVATLFIGILIMLMAFSIIELFISLSFSVMGKPFYGCD